MYTSLGLTKLNKLYLKHAPKYKAVLRKVFGIVLLAIAIKLFSSNIKVLDEVVTLEIKKRFETIKVKLDSEKVNPLPFRIIFQLKILASLSSSSLKNYFKKNYTKSN
ncbi:hypothetical protein N9Y89_00815 [bacterium]|nr:hypothetical protein [bacterium]